VEEKKAYNDDLCEYTILKCPFFDKYVLIDFLVLNATFSNISNISWRPVLMVEEAGVPGEDHRLWVSNW